MFISLKEGWWRWFFFPQNDLEIQDKNYKKNMSPIAQYNLCRLQDINENIKDVSRVSSFKPQLNKN